MQGPPSSPVPGLPTQGIFSLFGCTPVFSSSSSSSSSSSPPSSLLGLTLHPSLLSRVPQALLSQGSRRRGYSPTSARALLRFLRNTWHHVADLPPPVQRLLTKQPETFCRFWCSRFPELPVLVRIYIYIYIHITSSSPSIAVFNCTLTPHARPFFTQLLLTKQPETFCRFWCSRFTELPVLVRFLPRGIP